MADIFTFEQLLAYANNETDLLASDRIQRTIDGDPLIAADYQDIVQLINILNDAQPTVPEYCIDNILEKAKEM